MIKKILGALSLILLFAVQAYGQGSLYRGEARSTSGPVVPGALITVCTSGSPLTPVPCTAKASIFADSGLTVPAQNPLQADGNGNFQFYGNAGASYVVSVTGPGIASISFPVQLNGGGGGGGAPANPTGVVQKNSNAAPGSFGASSIQENAVGQDTFSGDSFFKSGAPWFDVKGIGAFCDGVSDDTAKLNTAYTNSNTAPGGGTVYYPRSSGACKFGTITLPNANIGTIGWLTSTFDNGLLGNQISVGAGNAFFGHSGNSQSLSGTFLYGPTATWEQVNGNANDFVDINAVNQTYFEGINFEANDSSNTVATVHSHDTGGGCTPNCAGSTWMTFERSVINGPQTTVAPAFLADASSNTQVSGFGFRANLSSFAANAGAACGLKFVNFGEIQISNSAIQGAGICLQNNGIASDGDLLLDNILSESIPANQPFLSLNSSGGTLNDITLRHVALADTNAGVYMVKNTGTGTQGLNFDMPVSGNIGVGLIDPSSTAAGLAGVFCKGAGCDNILTQAGAAIQNAFIFPINGRPSTFYQTSSVFDALDITANSGGFPDLGLHPTLGYQMGDSQHFGYSGRMYQPAAEQIAFSIAQAMPVTGISTSLSAGGSLTSGTQYFYIVRSLLTGSSCNTANQSAFSTEVTATPSGGNLTVVLSWTPGIGNFSGYCVYRGTTSLNESTEYFVNTQAATGFTDTGAAGTNLFIGNNVNGTFPANAQYQFNLTNLAVNNGLNYYTDTGAANAYVVTTVPTITSLPAGMMLSFKAANANTVSSTLNVDAIGAVTIKKNGNTANLAANDIIAGQIVTVQYDGTQWEIQSTLGNGAAGAPSVGAHQWLGNPATGTIAAVANSIGTQDVSPQEYVAAAGAVNVLTATLSPAVTSYVTGLRVAILPNLANTNTTPTLNVNGLGAKTITKFGTNPLANNDLVTTAIAVLIYDGTGFELQNPQTATGGAAIDTNGVANSSQVLLDFRTSVTNTDGLVVTPANPSGGRETEEITGTLLPVGGGCGLSSPTIHSLLIAEGAGNCNLLTSPSVNGFYQVGFNVIAGVGVDPVALLPGIPVQTPATPYTGLFSDRASFQRLAGGSTFSWTLPQVTGNTASNFAFVTANNNSGLLTFTANAVDKVNGSAVGGTYTVPSNWATFMYQDQTSAPGNWWPITLPQVGAFPAPGCTSFLLFSATSQVTCQGTTTAHFFLGNNTGGALAPSLGLIGASDFSPNAYIATTGAADVLVATYSPAVTALVSGLEVKFLPNNANATTTPTLNVNSLGAVTIVKSGHAALAPNDLLTTVIADVIYNAASNLWELQNPQTPGAAGTVTTSGSPTTGNPSCFSGSTVITNCTAHGMAIPLVCLDSSGSGTAQSCTTAPTFSPAAGDAIIYKTTTTNTGDVTVNVNSSSAAHIRKYQGTQVLVANDLQSGVYVLLVYDGTFWEISAVGNTAAVNPPFDKSTTGLSNPTADATFTQPISSTSGWTLAGTAPASVATATGTNATSLFNVSGVAGGADSNATGTGGIGSSPTIAAGVGGAGTGTNAVGGAGGTLTLSGGGAGASNGSGANANGGNVVALPGAAGTGGSGAAGKCGTFQVGASAPSPACGTGGGQVAAEGTPPTGSANNDDLSANSTSHALQVNNNNTGEMVISRTPCVNVTPVTVAANVATDQLLMACSLNANTLNVVGHTLKVYVAGVFSTAAASTASLTFKVKLCTVSGCGSGTVISPITTTTGATAALSATNLSFSQTSYITTQTAGASSAYEAHGFLTIDLSATAATPDSVYQDTNTATVGTIDSTGALFLQITVAASAASTSNSFTERQLVVELVN